jgi:hypothetical protein
VLVDRLCPSLPPPKLSLLFTSAGDTSKLASRPCRTVCARVAIQSCRATPRVARAVHSQNSVSAPCSGVRAHEA